MRVPQSTWDDFERALKRPARGGTRSATGDRALRDYFGAAELEELQDLAERAAAVRARGPLLGNVVLIPGIMGSTLAAAGRRDEDVVWVNVFRLALGRLADLRLSPDGQRDERPGVTVRATDVDKRTYARAVLRLRARWRVEPFPFDWRRDIDRSADALAAFIRATFKGQPVHIVAHSMGGLVARSFVRLNKRLWERMRGDGAQGGRLVMLGTPNFGSFAIPQVLTGAEKLVVWLSKLDLKHGLADVLDIVGGFVGSYQMLPAPKRLPEATRSIYRRELWGQFPVRARHLERAREFHDGLEDPVTIDPARMAYVAGCNRRTLAALDILAPGEFRYRETLDGDGRVTHALGCLPGVPTWYVEEDHGSLPGNARVLDAVDELLERGATALLADRPPPARAVLPEGGRWYRSVREHRTSDALEKLARRARDGTITPDEQRVAEETVLRAALGTERPAPDAEPLEEKRARAAGPRRRLTLEVVWGDAARVPAAVTAVGQYKGVHPVQKSALGALDAGLDGFLSTAITQGMTGGDLGELFFAPVEGRQVAPRTVLLAGMGAEGRFSQDDLRFLMMSVSTAVASLGRREYATVLIGAGAGSLSEDHALRGMLSGICEAILRLKGSQRLDKVQIIERDRRRFDRIVQRLTEMVRDDSPARLEVTVRSRAHASGKRRAPAAAAAAPLPFGPRITVERDGGAFRFSALTEHAVIPTREVELQAFFPDGIAERLTASTGRREQESLGRLLATTLLPEDFAEHLESADPVTFILDRSTASIPWEMGCVPTARGEHAFLGPHLALTRQFRTRLSPAPGIAPQTNQTLRVLVIADPAPEPEYQLPGARLEGRAVSRTLSRIKHEFGLDIEVVDRIGDAECDPVDVLSLILEGGFDVIHYAGHGVFDADNPAHGGWVFGRDRLLGSREIFRARRVPKVVFANACFSSVVNPGTPLSAAETNRQLAGIAEAFFERGVQNYIGAGWPVQDDLAVRFATTFYETALVGRVLPEAEPKRGRASRAAGKPPVAEPGALGWALRAARMAILHRGSTWGAYQHYGHGSDRLLRIASRE